MSLRCLDLPEIVSLICAELQRSQAYGSLAAFAATNTLICDVALDALWQWQDSLVYLLKTLPQHRIREIHPWDLRLVIDNPIRPEGWARMHSYASRITKLNLYKPNGGTFGFNAAPADGLQDNYYDLDIDVGAFERISSYAGWMTAGAGAERISAHAKRYPEHGEHGTPARPQSSSATDQPSSATPARTLFPRLRTLDCIMFEPKMLALFPVLFSPTITSLSIRMSKDADWLVQDLPRLCPNLTTLSWSGGAGLGGRDRDRAMPHPPFELLRRLQTLEILTTADLCIETIDCATQLPSLHSLQFLVGDNFIREVDALSKTPLDTFGRTPVNAMAPPSPSLHFSNAMRHIKLDLESPAVLSRFFNVVQTPLKVTAFDAQCYEEECDNGADVRAKNLELFSQALDPAHLRQLLYYHDCDIELSWGPVPAAHVLRLARTYPNMSYLGIDCWLDVADADLIELARALPQLEYLVLDTHAIDNRDYLDVETRNVRTTLGVLPAFAHYCPLLRGLCIRLDATEVPKLDIVDVEGVEEPRVQGHVRMYFAESKLSDPMAVARYLRRVFVRGCSIASQPPREGIYKRWHDGFWDDARTSDWAVGRWLEVRQALSTLEQEQD
ncbi:hypothetical protein K525DRAFT_271215 [Schizophyllum commune Loenen D]|nr:hypothetical protein K525DRAFT_271215 [Schizophyllum commune Loenen D]